MLPAVKGHAHCWIFAEEPKNRRTWPDRELIGQKLSYRRETARQLRYLSWLAWLLIMQFT